jgi:hypothetical protein
VALALALALAWLDWGLGEGWRMRCCGGELEALIDGVNPGEAIFFFSRSGTVGGERKGTPQKSSRIREQHRERRVNGSSKGIIHGGTGHDIGTMASRASSRKREKQRMGKQNAI